MNNKADYIESTLHLLKIINRQIAEAEKNGTGNDPFIKDMRESAREMEAFIKRSIH